MFKRLIFIFITAGLAIGVASCGGGDDEKLQEQLADRARLADILRLRPYRVNFFNANLNAEMPDGGRKIHINYLGGTLGRVFNDSNYLHRRAALEVGIPPVSENPVAWHIGRNMVKIESGPNYCVDNLTHSLPFLVEPAARLLDDIGRTFRDSLEARGGGDYKIKVTSVLRTPDLVNRLRRHNVNAVEGSTHLYGTTFDISYSKFVCDNPSLPRTQEDLKNLLGEVLFDLRRQGRCYVKYEHRQACYHITVIH